MKEKKFYLTEEGLERIKKEYNDLENLKSMKTKNDVPRIWQSEDLNPEYLSFQEDLSLLDARMSELENVLKNVELIKPPPKEMQGVVGIGATVMVEVDGQKDEYEILGSLEANPFLGHISNESPVGRALLGHKVGDEVTVSSPKQTIYKIKEIRYS